MYRKQRWLFFILAVHTVAVSLSMQHPWDCNSYYDALKDANEKTITEWLENGWDINQKDKRGYSVLRSVIRRPDMLTFLIEKGADIHERDDKGETLLHKAAWHGCPEVVEIVIANGIEVNALSHDGTTPLLCACERTHVEKQKEERFKIVQKLLAHGADVNKRSCCGRSVLHELASKDLVDIAKLVLAYGADVSQIDNKGKTCLSCVARNNVKMAHLYIKYSLAHSNVDLKKLREDGSGFLHKYIGSQPALSPESIFFCSLPTLREQMQSVMNNTDSKMRASYFLCDTLTELCLIREHGGDSFFGKDFLPLDMFKLILQEARTISQSTEVPLRPSLKRIQEIITFFKDEGFDQSDPDFMQQLEEYKNKQ
ncbi:MAG: ankyrin repeat domain-containing protein [Candidatus Babeliales bacterium]